MATYLNLGPIREPGLELSLDHALLGRRVSAFANYSYQDTPEIKDADCGQIQYPVSEVGIPSKNRFNVGLNYNSKRFLGSVSVNYADEALWIDVLNAPTTATPTPTPC